MCPGGVFVVGGVVSEAAVENADEPVRECAEGLVVGGAAGAVRVVERSRAG